MDNMRVHHSKDSNKAYKELSIEPVFNIPYCPQFNGIEAVFSIIKQHYKQGALQRIVAKQRLCPKEMI